MKRIKQIALCLITVGLAACTPTADDNDKKYYVSFTEEHDVCELLGAGEYKKDSNVTIEAKLDDGYKFEKWTVGNEEFSTSNPYTFSIDRNLELDVEYSLVDYYVYYTLNGGSLGTTTKTKFNVTTATFDLPIPTKNNYSFTGWTIKGTQESITSIKKGTTNDIYVVANWKEKVSVNVTVSYDSNKGFAYGSGTYGHGERITLHAAPKDGYKFEGWYENNKKVSESEIFYAVVYNDVTFEAVFSPIVYYIQYNLNGGVLPETAINVFTVETPTFKLPIPTKESGEFYDYEFAGWFNNKENLVEEITKGTIGDITLTAKWELKDKACSYKLYTSSTSWNYDSALAFEKTTDNKIFRLRLEILEGDMIAVGDNESFVNSFDVSSFGEFNAYVAGCYSILNSTLTFKVSGTYDIELNLYGSPIVLITVA